MIPLSQSLAKDFLACPRLAFYAHVLRRRLPSSDARLDGTVGHSALATYYSALLDGETQSCASTRALKIAQDAQLPIYRSTEAQALIFSYCIRYAQDQMTVLAVEKEFHFELDGQQWQGRIDLIARGRDDRVYVWEHKTTEEDISPGSRYWQRLDLDYQIPLYLLGAHSLGLEPAGVVYNVIARGVVRPKEATPEERRKLTKKGELYKNQRDSNESPENYFGRMGLDIGSRPDRYFQRQVIYRSRHEMAEARDDLISIGRLIRSAEEQNAWPKNGASCQRFGRSCDYLPVCMNQDSIDSYPVKERDNG